MRKQGKAIVLFSGGQDSTTCLYWALQRFEEVRALSIHYGQRHAVELDAARRIADLASVAHEVVELPIGVLRGTSALVDGSAQVGHYSGPSALPGGVEPTFVPMRNALFLVIAANRAAEIGAVTIVTGVCEEDYGGYPDCRARFIEAQEIAINEALGALDFDTHLYVDIQTPLMRLSKANTVRLAAEIPGCLDALAYSHTCYDGEYPPNPHNHASILRARGFDEALIPDPLIVRAKREGLLPDDYPDSGLVEGTAYALKDGAK